MALLMAASAQALPGDLPIVPLAPPDGANVPTDPDGITVSFTCPLYGVFQSGDFRFPGGPKDYGVSFSSSPAIGPDGRLADPLSLNQAQADPAADGQCLGGLGAGGSPPRPQETPGTYYWQAWRLCTGCDPDYETAPVRKIVLRSTGELSLGKAGKVFAGYPVIVPLKAPGIVNGTAVTVERKQGSGFKTVGTATALQETAEAVVKLPRGRQTLRATAKAGDDTVTSPTVTVKVKPAKKWSTSKKDTGAYQGKVGSRSVKFEVTRRGRELRSFKAFVPMTCPGIEPGQFTTQIGTAAFKKVKIAPDGRFVAASPGNDTTMRVRGRLHKRKVKGGRVELSVATCVGSAKYSASRRW